MLSAQCRTKLGAAPQLWKQRLPASSCCCHLHSLPASAHCPWPPQQPQDAPHAHASFCWLVPPPFQLLSSGLAWGGGVSLGRGQGWALVSRQRGPTGGSAKTGHMGLQSGKLLSAAAKQGEVGMGPGLTGEGTGRVEP